MTEKERRAFEWLYGTVVGYGDKEKIMKVDYLTSSDEED
jgi:hypothetical protein